MYRDSLLYLALLLHDTGKGLGNGEHVRASMDVANRAMDRLDLEREVFHETVRKAYLRIARKEPRRVRVIDGAAPADQVAETVQRIVEDRLRTLAAGYSMHVPKPVDPAELTIVVANLAGRT